jgi:hypothetical protein
MSVVDEFQLPLPAELVRRIGMLRKRCGLSDEEYYALLSGYGVDSCKDLQVAQAKRIIAFFEGIEPKGEGRRMKYEELGFRPDFATPAQLRMLEAMWKDVSFCVLSGKRAAAWREFLWTRFSVIGPEGIAREDVGKIKRTLEAMYDAQQRKKKRERR